MNLSRFSQIAFALILSTVPLVAQNASTPIYNFQFAGYGNGVPTAYSGTAALGYGGNTFNNIILPNFFNPTVTFANAVDSFGVASAVSLTVSGQSQYVYSSGPAGPTSPQTLLSQYLYSGGEPNVGTFTLANLAPNAAYKLYLYGGDGFNESKGTLFNVIGGTANAGINTTTAAQNTYFAEGVNFVWFTGVTDATGSVTGTYQQGGSINPFNGLQINTAAVPEPGTVAFFMLTSVSLLVRKKTQRN